jgi:predicted transcriptional regulator with HTH domain
MFMLPVVPTYASQIKHVVAENDVKVGDVNLTQVSAVYSGKAPLVTPGLVAVVIEGMVK